MINKSKELLTIAYEMFGESDIQGPVNNPNNPFRVKSKWITIVPRLREIRVGIKEGYGSAGNLLEKYQEATNEKWTIETYE